MIRRSFPTLCAVLTLAAIIALFGCKHAITARQSPPAPVPGATRQADPPPDTAAMPRVQQPAPPRTTAVTEEPPSPEPPADRLPEAYRRSFGGWATAVKCSVTKDCAKPPAEAPAHLQVASYVTARHPEGPVAPGETVHIRSRILILAGKDHRPEDVLEGIVLTAHGGESGRLLKGINLHGGAGEFETDFQLQIPKDAPPGQYSVHSTLFVAKQPVDAHTLTFDVHRVGRDKL